MFAAAAITTALPAGNAFAINQVSCNNNEFVKITYHMGSDRNIDQCFANGGTYNRFGQDAWVVRIWTGNNRVQWLGDNRWQPATAIGKQTSFTWPNHSGGVRMAAIRII
ncbi:beta/gamma crystallin domain-containing protein [Umezawaea beigongshangensis]|uniref:beta/gamma crystallin domain-containing protein n=1 Tax=Umezawaea beigongshangensis TaxID=2780383 RepID=UPI0018F246C0|nr:beta/gamma crystallin domain-containing protein [Umezawaea beigongshangensis]